LLVVSPIIRRNCPRGASGKRAVAGRMCALLNYRSSREHRRHRSCLCRISRCGSNRSLVVASARARTVRRRGSGDGQNAQPIRRLKEPDTSVLAFGIFGATGGTRSAIVKAPKLSRLDRTLPADDGSRRRLALAIHRGGSRPRRIRRGCMDHLLKPSDLARRLGVSRSWLYDAAKSGRIPSIRIGGKDGPLRFVAEDIDRWIEEARAAWTPGKPAVGTRHVSARPNRPRRPHESRDRRII
jgi:excisionase family DNA binding protein